MNIPESDTIFRKSILKGFFEPQLLNLDFKKSTIKYPSINDRELIHYKYGKDKKLDDALDFLKSKYKELYELLEPLQKDLM